MTVTGRVLIFCVYSVSIALSMTSCSQPTPPKSVPLTISEVRIGSDLSAAATPSGPQLTSQPIAIRIAATGGTGGEQLKIRLIELGNGKQVGVQSLVWSPDKQNATVDFKSMTGTWTPGRYLVEITMNDKLVSHHELDIYPSQM